jgi:hypothetical protein
MLSTAMVLEIRRLIVEGELSQRAIAATLGVSHGTVSNIARGKRGIYGCDDVDEPPVDERPLGPPVRCRGCGGRVYQPCLLCQARPVHERALVTRRTLSELQRSRERHAA